MTNTKKQSKYQGFTIVELVIVIAVIAILAAVTIPTFSSIVDKSRVSAVLQVATNLNKPLAACEALGEPISSMHDVMRYLEEYDISQEDTVYVKGDYCLVWNSKSNRFVAFDSEAAVVCGEEDESTPRTKLWQVVDVLPTQQVTSLYLADGFVGNTISVEVGVDVGNNDGISKIIYTDVDNAVKDILIRVNDPDTEVDLTNKGNDHVTVIGIDEVSAPEEPENTDPSDEDDTSDEVDPPAEPDTPTETDPPVEDEDEDEDENGNGEEVGNIVAQEGKVVYSVLDNQQYDSLTNAMTLGGELILLADVKECSIEVTKDVLLDLNGFTVGYSNEQSDHTVIINGGALTVTDSSEDKSGVIFNNANPDLELSTIRLSSGSLTLEEGTLQGAKCAIYAEDNTSVTVKGGTVKGVGSHGMGVFIMSGAALTVNGGRIATENSEKYAIVAKESESDYTITINGGMIEATIAHIGAGSLTVNDGIIKGETAAVIMKKGRLEINGGELIATSQASVAKEYFPKSKPDDDFETVGAAIHVDTQSFYQNNRLKGEIIINSGRIASSNFYMICLTACSRSEYNHSMNITIKGGDLVSKEGYETILRHSYAFGTFTVADGISATQIKK